MAFPIKSENLSIDNICLGEGYHYSPMIGAIAVDAIVSYNPANALTSIVTWAVIPGRLLKLNSIDVSTDTKVYMQVQIDSTTNSGKITYRRVKLLPDQVYTFFFENTFLRGNDQLKLELFQDVNAATANVRITASAPNGIDLTDDINYGAGKKILFVGDSIMYGANVAPFRSYRTNDIYTFKTRNYYLDKGIDVRMINMSTHAISTTMIDNQRVESKFDSKKWDLIIYSAGTNDTIANASAGTIATQLANATINYGNFINWKKTRQPNAKLLMLGCPPVFNATRESQLAGLRTAMSNEVISKGDAKTYYLTLGDAFDGTVATNYNEATGTDGVHPNLTPNVLMYDKIKTFLDTNIPTL